MASYSRVKPPQSPPNNKNDLSSLYSRPSIQNSSHWPSINSHSPGPSVRTLNQSDGGTYRDDISPLANCSSEDIDPSVRGSVFTANRSASPSSNRPSAPSGGFHRQYQHLPLSLEKSGESRRSGGSTQSRAYPSIRADKRPNQPPLVLNDTIIDPPLQSTGGHVDHESIPQVTKVTKSLLRETQPGVTSAEQMVELWRYNANLVFKPGEAVVSPDCKYQTVL
jgi:hypothetical protein